LGTHFEPFEIPFISEGGHRLRPASTVVAALRLWRRESRRSSGGHGESVARNLQMRKPAVYHNKARFRALPSQFRRTIRDITMPENQSHFAVGGPVFSLAVLAIAIVAVLAMVHFR